MNGLFITGTDTDAGKTAVAALLLAELRLRNMKAIPMKPVQTGCAEGSVPDLDYALSMAKISVPSDTYRLMAPYTFKPACSPHLAAERANTEIDLSEIVIAARTLTQSDSFLLVEGAGGIMVPLNRRETMLDLMNALKLPVLLVARPGLGTINHTLLSIRTLRSDGLDIAGVVFISTTNQPIAFIEQDNFKTVEQFGKVPVLGHIPYSPALATTTPCFDDLPESIPSEIKKIVDAIELNNIKSRS